MGQILETRAILLVGDGFWLLTRSLHSPALQKKAGPSVIELNGPGMPKRLLGFLFPAAAARGDDNRAEPPQLDAITDAQARGQVYISDLPADIEPARKLLQSYSGIRAKDVDGHIQTIVCHPSILTVLMMAETIWSFNY